MKKICIISSVNIIHMSLISRYTDFFNKNSIDFDLIYMDKYDIEEKTPAKRVFRFVNIINPKQNRLLKVLRYLRFRKFAIPILKKERYDYVIVWNDVAIYTFGLFLSRKYKGRYCLNIRDYMKQDIFPFNFIYNRAVKNSHFTTVSSKGFIRFLPKYNYTVLHSINYDILDSLKRRSSKAPLGLKPLRITFVGSIRYFDINSKLLDIFKNDKRFEMHFHGSRSEVLERYAEENGIFNVVITGTFPLEESGKFIIQTDLVNNLYGINTMNLKTAISIKFYHALYLRVPIIVFADTYIGDLVSQFGLGFVVKELSSNLPDILYSWYESFDYEIFSKKCDIFLDYATQEEKDFEKRVIEIIT